MPTVPRLQPVSSDAPSARRAVFLDRDGTLMEEVDYCGDPARVRLLPGVTSALHRLKAAGFRLVIVTNQSGIGRGYFSETDFQSVQAELLRQLDSPGLIDATYHCPDNPDQASERRKPGVGMITEAAEDFGLDLLDCYIVGDSSSDVLCGQRAGLAGSALVMTGHGRSHLGRCEPDRTVADLAEAAVWITGQISLYE